MIRFVVSVLFVALMGCAGPRQLSSSGAGAYEASLTVRPGRSAVAWYDTRGGNAEIYAREVDQNGRGVGPEHRLTTGSADSYEADIVSINDAFTVAWYEQTPSGESRAKLGLWNSSFEPLWIVDLSPAGRDSRIPVVETFENRIFCAWVETGAGSDVSVRAGWWDMEGRVVIEPRVLGAAGATTWNLNSAIDAEGLAYVVFDAKVGTRSEELFLARVDDTDIDLERITADDGVASKYPDLALAAEGAALTWLDDRDGNVDVYLLVGSSSALAEDIGVLALQVTESPGESMGAHVAWNDGRVGLVWSDDSVGQHEIYFQSFDSSGLAINDPARLTHNRTASFIPSIQASADTFMLSWNEVVLDRRGELTSDARSEIAVVVVPER
jgi:hypothetical protein